MVVRTVGTLWCFKLKIVTTVFHIGRLNHGDVCKTSEGWSSISKFESRYETDLTICGTNEVEKQTTWGISLYLKFYRKHE